MIVCGAGEYPCLYDNEVGKIIHDVMCPECDHKLSEESWKRLDKIVEEILTKKGIIQPAPQPEITSVVTPPETFTLPDGTVSLYEITLTTPTENPSILEQYVNKILTSKMYKVLGYIYSYELTQSGLPHVHMLVCCGVEYFNSSKLKYPYRATFTKVRDPDAFFAYITKSKDDKNVQQFCKKHNLQQIIKKNL